MRPYGLTFEMLETSFFISRQTILASGAAAWRIWRQALYVTMARNARSAADYFRLPRNRVIELGAQIEI